MAKSDPLVKCSDVKCGDVKCGDEVVGAAAGAAASVRPSAGSA
jgi:hypothetical protein